MSGKWTIVVWLSPQNRQESPFHLKFSVAHLSRSESHLVVRTAGAVAESTVTGIYDVCARPELRAPDGVVKSITSPFHSILSSAPAVRIRYPETWRHVVRTSTSSCRLRVDTRHSRQAQKAEKSQSRYTIGEPDTDQETSDGSTTSLFWAHHCGASTESAPDNACLSRT
ncbi:hypothetical protein CBL_07535 [Carabus blaptoides fortunei]